MLFFKLQQRICSQDVQGCILSSDVEVYAIRLAKPLILTRKMSVLAGTAVSRLKKNILQFRHTGEFSSAAPCNNVYIK